MALQKKLPLALVLPQAGQTLPAELTAHGYPLTPLPAPFTVWSGWPDLSGRLAGILRAPLAPAILQVDAPADDALPDFLPDGNPVYPADRRLYHHIRRLILQRYYHDFYRQMQALAANHTVRLGFILQTFAG